MKILAWEHKNFGIEDMKEAMANLGNDFRVISTELLLERNSKEFDALFEEAMADRPDVVFSFNYSAVISNNCNRYGIPYVAWVYDSPLLVLYSYTITNPCNYIFLFDSAQYLELKNGGIDTVYYMPLAANVDRLARMRAKIDDKVHAVCDSAISFVGSMYNEKGNFYERLEALPDYVKGYLEGIMEAQLEVYGANFIEELLTSNILEEIQRVLPYRPAPGGVESPARVYADYFLGRKMAQIERQRILLMLSEKYTVKLFTHHATPNLPKVTNMGAIDYYDVMPYVFMCSDISLNISLRSIRSGIPLRCMDIMGAGGFLLTNYQADFENHFVAGEDYVYYDSANDCLSKCDYYLSHASERNQIAANALGKMKEFHTYEATWKRMMEYLPL